MLLTIVRHGLTQANTEQLWVGVTDVPLSQAGLEQARLAHKDESIRRVFVTPLMRTRQTAALLYPNAEQIIAPGLREMSFGIFEGKSNTELFSDPVFVKWNENDGMYPMPEGEGRQDFALRVARALDTLVRAAIEAKDDSLHILAHGGTIMALLGTFAVPHKPYREWWTENLCGFRARIEEEMWIEQPALYDLETISFSTAEA